MGKWLKRILPALAVVAVVLAAGPSSAQETSAVQVRIVYPADKMSLPNISRTFVYGSVVPPGAYVTVNGLDSPMVRSAMGGWMALIPVKPGKFTVTARAVMEDGTVSWDTHRVTVAKDAGPAVSTVSPGDLAVHKTPNEKIWKPSRIGRISSETAYLRAGPNSGDDQAGYELPLQKHVLVEITGDLEKTLHVRLSDLESVWIDAAAVKLLPKQTPRPESLINSWTARRLARSTIFQTKIQELLPYRVTVSPDGRSLSIKIYGGISNTDWIHYASDDPWIRQAGWSHPLKGVYQMDVELRRPVWGYDIRYENFKLTLELRDPPPGPPPLPPAPVVRRREPPPEPNHLADVKICIDPGHPPMGATGPLGTAEHSVNWKISEAVSDVLTRAGAQVILTRQDNETAALPDRVLRARLAGADLFVSIHANAVAPADNPFEKNGFSVYYFQPFSQPMAEAVHAALRERLDIRDDGLHYGNLHVVRQSFMPSILVECAYLIWPPEEELLLDPNFQYHCAHAVASGIRTFLEKRRVSGDGY